MFSSGERPIRIALPTQFAMGTVNSYLFKSPVPTLIDCGEKSEESWQALISGLKQNGLQIKDIERIIITHAHVDHMGMAAKVAEAAGAKVWVSEYVKDWAINLPQMQSSRWKMIQDLITEIANKKDSPLHQGFGRFFNNYKEYWEPIPLGTLEIFSLNDSLEIGRHDWKVMHAPGHCVNQTCFYNPTTRELLAADMLLRVAPTPVIDPSIEDPSRRSGGLSEMIATMQSFKALDMSIAYPGHYDPIDNGQEILQNQLERIDHRINQTLEIIKTEPKHFFEILGTMYKGRVSGPAVPMMIGYLDILLDRGHIHSKPTEEGLQYFVSAN